jgi:predicted Zn-dependent peptidase
MGLENHKNLTASSIQRFQLENIKPENMIICGAGIRNHNELVELVQYKLDNLGLLSV